MYLHYPYPICSSLIACGTITKLKTQEIEYYSLHNICSNRCHTNDWNVITQVRGNTRIYIYIVLCVKVYTYEVCHL